MGESIVNSAAKLTIFLALESLLLTVTSRCKEIPEWIPEEERERYIADYGEDKPAQIAAAYVKQKCLELVEYLSIQEFFEREALDFLVTGDAFVNVVSNAYPYEEQEVWNAPEFEAWQQDTDLGSEIGLDGKPKNKKAKPVPTPTRKAVDSLIAKRKQEGRGSYNILALQGLNPSAVWMYPDFAGRITNAKVVHLLGEGVWDLNLDNLIHLKSFAWTWVVYGVSHYISALKWVDIKFKMMDALYLNAQRYISPKEWLTIKGPEAPENKAALPPTEQQMAWADEIMSSYSAGTPFVLPSGWEWNYLGAEGKVLRTEMLFEKVDDAIRTAAQVSRTFTSGAANVPAYATSKLQAGVMLKAIAPIGRIMARAIEGRILRRFCLFNGFFEDDGTLIAPKVEYKPKPIHGDDSAEKKIAALGMRGWLSPITAWEFEGIDPNLEMERIAMAQQGLVEPFRAIAPDLSPSQTPDRFDELREDIDERFNMIGAARAKGHEKLMQHVEKALQFQEEESYDKAETEIRKLGKYLTQAAYLQRSDARNLLDHAEDWESQVYRQKEQNEAMRDPDCDEVTACATVTETVRHPSAKYGHGEVPK